MRLVEVIDFRDLWLTIEFRFYHTISRVVFRKLFNLSASISSSV